MKRWLPFLFSLLLTLSTTGCWDVREMNEVSFVTGMAVDLSENGRYVLTVESVNPTELAGKRATGNAPVTIHSQEGDSIGELVHRMNVSLSRRLSFSHMRVLAISEELAREGVIDFLDFLEREQEIRDDFNLLIARGVKAADIISTTYPLQKIPSLKIRSQTDSLYKEWAGDPHVRLQDFIGSLTSNGRQPVAEVATVVGNPQAGHSVANNKSLRPNAVVRLEGMAVFRKDKMIGSLSLNDTRNYVITQNLLQQTSLTVPYDKEDSVIVRVYNSSTKMHVDVRDGKPVLVLKVFAEGRVDGTQHPLDLSKHAVYVELEKKTAAFLANKIERTVKKVQTTYGVDIFGFGEEFYREDPKAFKPLQKQWDQVFADADVEVNPIVRIRRSGIRTKSLLEEMK